MKYLLLTIAVLAVTIVISQVFVSKNSTNTETINYTTLAVKDGFEIRKYPKLVVATTTFEEGTYSDISGTGFRRIASYIFGGNSDNTQISMTSPVQMEISESPSMSFFMPSEMEVEDLPKPQREDVVLTTQPSKIVAVIEFSGWASDKMLKQKYNELVKKLRNDNIQFEEGYCYLGYNPPYQMMNRKNEVVITLNNYND